MAERTPLKFADRNAIPEEDPFAELTRIMGFDPRQPVARHDAPDPVMGDEFDIDLEKELMGEFGLEDEAEISEAPQLEAVSVPADDIEPEYDLSGHDLSGDDLSEHDLAGDDLPEHDLSDLELTDLELDDQPSESEHGFAASVEQPQAVAPEVEFERDFDEALTRTFGNGTDWSHHEATAQEHAPAEVEAAPAYDEAMPDIDLDLDLDDEPQAPSLSQADEGTAWEKEIEASFDPHDYDANLHAEAIGDDIGDALSADIDEALAAVPAAEPIAPQASVPEAPIASEERSLEDELNALLGNMGARISRPENAAPHQAWTASAHPEAAADPFAVAAVGFAAHQSAAAPAAAAVAAEPPASTGPAYSPMASVTSIFSRSWNRATPVQPAPVEDAPAAVVDKAPAYQPEPDPVPAYESVAQEEPAQPVEAEQETVVAAYDDIPDVETVDVPERVQALVDDLDLPELAFEEDRPAPAEFDDLEAEFSGLINDMSDAEAAPEPVRSASYDDEPYEAGFNKRPAPAEAAPAAMAAAALATHDGGYAPQTSEMPPFAPAESFDADPLGYDPELDEEIAIPEPAVAGGVLQPGRRGLLAAAVLGAVVVVGGLGAYALSPGGSSDGAPVLVKADDTPIKVKPENPGGTVVPNQDNKVYEAVAKGVKPAAPQQQELVADAQQPVNVNTAAPQNRVVDLSGGAQDEATPQAKSEDRIAPDTQQAVDAGQNVPLVSPRKVRTMIVKPDGTLAPREEVVPASANVEASEPADPAPQRVVTASGENGTHAGDRTGTVPATAETTAAAAPAAAPAAPKADTQSATTPQTVAAVPQRPSDQPVDVVGEVKPDQVASIAPTAAASGSWSMQIASQPSADAAQSTYKDLARRYASVLDGQPVNIVKAEIAGKGTFYRVRIPANSRNDAIKLCESYKAAGGNCFVSK